jgi:hypothetical protein
MFKRHITLAGAVLAGLLTTVAIAPAAHGVEASDLRPAGGTHCVSQLVPVGSTAKVPAPRCFGSFAEMISFATGGAVRLPADATRVTQAQLDVVRPMEGTVQPPFVAPANVVVGISYKDTGFSGDSWAHQATAGCDNDAGYEWQNATPFVGPDGTWNNAISSAEGFSDCTGRYWEFSNHTGANVDTDWSGGAMNNATSSIKWY